MFLPCISSANNSSFKALSFFLFLLSSVLLSSAAQARMTHEDTITTTASINSVNSTHNNAALQYTTSDTYSTTNGNFHNFNADPKVDHTIIFSLITTILLGFLTLFGAIQLPKSRM